MTLLGNVDVYHEGLRVGVEVGHRQNGYQVPH